jgi:signal transduction histidine kinase
MSRIAKTPLALIRLFAETLEFGRVKDERKAHEYYLIISRESSRLTGLIDNILDFSQIEAGRKKYHLAPADAGEIVEKVVRDYKYRLDAAGFKLDLDIARGAHSSRAEPAPQCLEILAQFQTRQGQSRRESR